ncbi:hypothetical protein AYK24_09790 [Thermoplasmatales archaeon SG8-52-4]|nr:MAG: hypothetical protein AYK24_09790 [Thermoplasmatales archaeon SG8-52-4]
MQMQKLMQDKKGGVVSSTVTGIGMLIISVIIILVIVSTLMDANLLTGSYDTVAGNMTSNFTAGLENVSTRLPTILLIVAVVFLFGALVLLVTQARRMGAGGGGSL